MKKELISTTEAPSAIGPYSQGAKIGEMIYTSGQIPINPATGEIPAGIMEQSKQALTNLQKVVEAGGGDLTTVVKTLIFIKDMNDFATVNEIYSTFFTENCPARSCVEVARLPKDVLIEIEAIALVK